MDKPKRIIVLSALGFSVILIILGFIFTPKTKEAEPGKGQQEKTLPRVVVVEPLENQKGLSVVPQVVVSFSTSVAGRNVELKTEPPSRFTAKTDLPGDKVVFSPVKNLKPKTRYDLKVLVDSDPVFFWSATTKQRETTQKDLAVKVNGAREKMPVVESGFRISYDAPGDRFYVFIEKAPFDTYKNKAISWFRQTGVKDLAALNLNYVGKGSVFR